MKELPASQNSLVVRTDFTDEAAWVLLCSEIEAPVGALRAYVSCLSDSDFDGLTTVDLMSLAKRGPYRSFLFIVDRESLKNPEHPILVLDLLDDPGRTFRVIPVEMWGVENNLSISNMDFSEFADNADADNVFRGFRDG